MPTALLVIDVPAGSLPCPNAAFEVERVIDRINLVSQRARAAGALVGVIQHESEGTGEMDNGTDAWKLALGLKTADGDVYVRKEATDSFHQTELQCLVRRSNLGAPQRDAREHRELWSESQSHTCQTGAD